jgi:type 1 fimbria pilin
MPKSKSLLALAATLTVAAAVTGCAQASDPDSTDANGDGQSNGDFTVDVTVDYTDEEVTLAEGDVLEVDFGTINMSIGDEWGITSQPDSSVVVNTVRPGDPNATAVAPGSDTEFSLYFEAVGTGETSVTFQYSYRGTETTPADGPGSTTLTIKVE